MSLLQDHTIEVLIKKIRNSIDIPLPFYATKQSAGVDLMADIDLPITIEPNEIKLIPTGIALQIPNDHEIQIRSRSGLSLNHGIIVLNSPATIDADYRGELQVILINLGKQKFIIERGMKIAQMLIKKTYTIRFHLTETLDSTERGNNGFGSTGK